MLQQLSLVEEAMQELQQEHRRAALTAAAAEARAARLEAASRRHMEEQDHAREALAESAAAAVRCLAAEEQCRTLSAALSQAHAENRRLGQRLREEEAHMAARTRVMDAARAELREALATQTARADALAALQQQREARDAATPELPATLL